MSSILIRIRELQNQDKTHLVSSVTELKKNEANSLDQLNEHYREQTYQQR